MTTLQPAGTRVAFRRRAAGSGWTNFGIAALAVCVACSKDSSTTSASQTSAGTRAPDLAVTATQSAGMNALTTPTASMSSAPVRAATGGTAATTTGTVMSSGGATASAGATAGVAAAGSSGRSASGGCSRDLLRIAVDTYFAALAAHDPVLLKRADNLKFTENGRVMELGQGLWQTAGIAMYKHSALDVETCTSVSESVVPDASTDMEVPVGLRLKLENGRVSEIETIVVRPGDYKVFGSSFPSNTDAIAASKDRVQWEQVVPADQRNTREEIQDWLDKYFRLFPRHGCNLADDCQRLENGGGSFECSAALSCDMSATPAGRGSLIPRTFVIDTETGIGVGFTMFMGNTDFHMIKMYGGEIHAVHAILGAASSSGWE
jgi:hypothetical protein